MKTDIYLDLTDRLEEFIAQKSKIEHDYFSYMNKISNFEKKYPKVIKGFYENYDFTIKQELLQEKMGRLLKFIKKFPILERKRFWEDKTELAYWQEFLVKQIDFIEKQLKENPELFCKYREYYGGIRDDFHKLYTYCKTENKNFIKKLFWKRKAKSLTLNERYYIKGILDFFQERVKRLEEEKNLYSNKRKFKKQKKKVFVFEVEISWIKISLDYAHIIKEKFPLIISHFDEKQARESIYYTYGENLYDGLIKDLSKSEINQINKLKITKLETNKENIKKALEYKKENFWHSKYFPYGRIFKEMIF